MLVIATSKGREKWLGDCLASLANCTVPILVLRDYDYELGKIRWVYEHTDLDEFLLIQDSVIIKDPSFIQSALDFDGSVSIAPGLGMFMGKYRRSVLDKLEIPAVTSKRHSVELEGSWTSKYLEAEHNFTTLFPELFDTDKFEKHNGRLNMIIENDYLIKYKGSWLPEMLDD